MGSHHVHVLIGVFVGSLLLLIMWWLPIAPVFHPFLTVLYVAALCPSFLGFGQVHGEGLR
ncbi:hypothetical protein B0T09DRAFT_343091 [Sordaria sp. MPI-SDFR-AT-0083]|nr:hypothetical protein B0T09DRAFT_343091 [Sordaria sp. MPI-SDFR-AT-0083]